MWLEKNQIPTRLDIKYEFIALQEIGGIKHTEI